MFRYIQNNSKVLLEVVVVARGYGVGGWQRHLATSRLEGRQSGPTLGIFPRNPNRVLLLKVNICFWHLVIISSTAMSVDTQILHLARCNQCYAKDATYAANQCTIIVTIDRWCTFRVYWLP